MSACTVVLTVMGIISDAVAYDATVVYLDDSREYSAVNVTVGAIAIMCVVGGGVSFVLRRYKTSLALLACTVGSSILLYML